MMLKQTNPFLKPSGFENPFFRPDDAMVGEILGNSFPSDPSMQSLSYIKMTSRKGLSCFQGRFCKVLFSKHPNLDDTQIIYPSQVEGAQEDILDLAKILKMTGDKVQIIRVPTDVANDWAAYFAKPAVEEQVLDYKYPVHILDVETSLGMRGTKFLKFRNKLNAISRLKPEIRSLAFSSDEKVNLKKIVRDWAPLVFKSNYEASVEYINYALDELTASPNVRGLIVGLNNLPVGFTIWEVPAAGFEIANSLIHCAVHERGLSECLHYEMMSALRAESIKFLSLGGAEDEGLDAFKRKMNPVMSVELKTICL